AIIRNGDYPREKGVIDVTVILSELRDVEKLRQYYQESVSFMQHDRRKQLESESKLKAMDDASKDIPSL
ncbi:cell division protein FtsZ, partial [Chloroflexota bacterium]